MKAIATSIKREPASTYLHLSHAYPQIRFIKLVRNIPPQWTKLSPLLHHSMEEAQSKQHLMPSVRLQVNHNNMSRKVCLVDTYKHVMYW